MSGKATQCQVYVTQGASGKLMLPTGKLMECSQMVMQINVCFFFLTNRMTRIEPS